MLPKERRVTILILGLFAAYATGRATAAPAATPAGDLTYPHLARGFMHPPASARPWVYWFWLNGNVTREGITADLEAMRRAACRRKPGRRESMN